MRKSKGQKKAEGLNVDLLIADAENVLATGTWNFARTQGVWTSREKAEGRVARRHRATEAIVDVYVCMCV